MAVLNNTGVLAGSSIASGDDFKVTHSCHFDGTSSIARQATSAVDFNNDFTWTVSWWMKPHFIDTEIKIWGGLDYHRGRSFQCGLTSDGKLALECSWGSWYSKKLIRDSSAWYHCVVAYDSTQATQANRVKVFVNGEEWVASAQDYPSQNYASGYNGVRSRQWIGCSMANYTSQVASKFYRGNISHWNLVQSLQLHPKSFAETNASGKWVPIAFKDNYSALTGSKTGTHADWKASRFATDSSWQGTTSTSSADRTFNNNYWDGGLLFGTTYVEVTTQDLTVASNLSITHNGGSGTLVTIKDGDGNEYQVDDGGNGELLTVFNGNSQSGTSFTGTMNGPIYAKQAAGSSYLYSVWIDGCHLVNNHDYRNRDGHRSDIRFNDTTSNASFWKDYRDIGKLENATGALPIRATTDDFGNVVDGTSFRTDPLASNLTLALPLNGNVTDYSATIKGSGTAASVTSAGDYLNDIWDNYFYQSSAGFGKNGYLEWENVKPIADGSGTWCIECWLMCDNNQNGQLQIYDSSRSTATSTGIYLYTSSGKVHAWARGTQIEGGNSGQLMRDRWTHVAFTMNSGHGRLFIDGQLAAENSSFQSGGQVTGDTNNTIGVTKTAAGAYTQFFEGNIQDFRIYDGTAKYTSSFQPPLRATWHPENINTKIQDDSKQNSKTIWQEMKWTGDGNTNRQITPAKGNIYPGFGWFWQENATGDPFHWSVNAVDGSQGDWLIDSNDHLESGRMDRGETPSEIYSKEFNATGPKLIDTNMMNQNTGSETYRATVFAGAADGSFVSDTSQDINCMRSTNSSKTVSIIHFQGDGAANSEFAHGLGKTPCLALIYGKDNYFKAYTREGPHSYFSWNDGLYSTGNGGQVSNGHFVMDANRCGSDDMANGNNAIAICFAPQTGLLAAGSYTGNDQSDGPTFNPGFQFGGILIKRMTNNGGWLWSTCGDSEMLNSGRDVTNYKWLNDTYGTRTDGGYKIRGFSDGTAQIITSGNWGGGALNANNDTYFWMAFSRDAVLATSDKNFDFVKDSPFDYVNPADSQDVSGNFSQPMYPTQYALDDGRNYGGTLRKEANFSHLTGMHTSNGWRCAHGSIPIKSGKWYFETEVIEDCTTCIGVVKIDDYTGDQKTMTSARAYDEGGNKVSGGTSTSYGDSWNSVGDVVGVGVDLDNGTIDFWKNGTHQGQAFNDLTPGDTYLTFLQMYNYGYFHMNYGIKAFKYTNYGTNRPADTYLPICTATIADPTITDPSKHFNAVTYSGTGSEKAINDFAFQPDLLFLKKRNSTGDWQAYDAERGATKVIHPNTGEPHTTIAEGVKSFDSDGFTLGTDSEANGSGQDYIAYGWDAGTAQAASGTWGSNNKAYSRWTSADTGLSIIKWTGDGSQSLAIPHGLGKKPKVYIWRQFEASSQAWYVNIDCRDGSDDYLAFTQGAKADQSSAAFDATYISNWGASDGNNLLGYVFSEVDGFSKIGSFKGSGQNNDNGPFTFTGFRPALLIYKNLDEGSTDWVVYDDVRGELTSSVAGNADEELQLNNNSATTTGRAVNFHSNGFQIRGSADNTRNQVSDKFLYLAFARKPFKFSNGAS